jgi:uncharacterized repeat protein (TIGR03803 family)
VLGLAIAGSQAQNYKILHTFGADAMGYGPASGLVQGADGTLYGTTVYGGAADQGQVFKVDRNGTGYTALKDFIGTDGAVPSSRLTLSGATLYGTTANGGSFGNGVIFKVNTDGTGFAVLKDFTNELEGTYQSGGLVISGSTIYGATVNGGSTGNGTIFAVNTDGYQVSPCHTNSATR